MWGIDPAGLAGLGGLVFVLVLLIIGIMSNQFFPSKTVKMMLADAQAHAAVAVKLAETYAARDVKIAEDHSTETRVALANQLTELREDMNGRMESFRSDHAIRVEQSRVDHDKQLAALALVTEGVRKDFATVLASKETTIDHWVSAWHLADQAGREEIAGKLDELVAGSRAFARWVAAFQDQTGVPQLPHGGE